MALRVDEEQTVAVFLISGRKGSCMPRLLLGAAALALVLAGCGGDPESTPSPEVTLTTPVDASASASPAPTLPAAAQADTKAGAIAFVKHYVELINHAQATGDVDQVEDVEDPACRSCAAARDGLEDHYSSGGTIHGGEWSIEAVQAVRNRAINGWVVDLSVSFTQQVVKFGSSRPDDVNESGRMVVSVQVAGTAGGWRVRQWTRG